jgi:hypothetical protein
MSSDSVRVVVEVDCDGYIVSEWTIDGSTYSGPEYKGQRVLVQESGGERGAVLAEGEHAGTIEVTDNGTGILKIGDYLVRLTGPK